MKKKLLAFLILLSLNINAQNKKDLPGFYKDSSGAVIKINNDNSFVIVGYATVYAGKWHLTDQYIELIPDIRKHTYEVYGRREPSLKGSKIMFMGFEENRNFLKTAPETWLSVFNESPNCFSFPYVKDFPEGFKTISLCNTEMFKQGIGEIAENNLNYNDFIIISNNRNRRIRPVTYRVLNNTLYDRYEDVPLRRTELNEEDRKMFSTIENEAGNFSEAPERLYANPAYNMDIPDMNEEQYTFDKKRNTYIDRLNKDRRPGDAYHDLRIVNEYTKIRINPSNATGNIEKGSLFYASCSEN